MRAVTLAFLLAICGNIVTAGSEDGNASVQLDEEQSGVLIIEEDENSHRSLRRRPTKRPPLPPGVTAVTNSRGITTFTLKLRIWYWLRPPDMCFNVADVTELCDTYLSENLEIADLYKNNSGNAAMSFAAARGTCWSMARAASRVNALLDAEVKLSVKQRQIGRSQQVQFRGRLRQCQLSVAYSRSFVDFFPPYIKGTAGASTDPKEMCRTFSPRHPLHRVICADGEVDAYGTAYAASNASSFTRALNSTWNHYLDVESRGLSVDSVKAVVLEGASNFSRAETIADAYANVTTIAIDKDWVSSCMEWHSWYCRRNHPKFCSWNSGDLCKDAHSHAKASSGEVAMAISRAAASSWADLEVTFGVQARFARDPISGRIVLGLSTKSGFSAGAVTTCKPRRW